MTPEEKRQLEMLRKDLNDLTEEFYRNNFSDSQDFQKYSRFNTRVKVPTLSATPATCEVGELCVVSSTGKVYVCSSANTWTIVGTQS